MASVTGKKRGRPRKSVAELRASGTAKTKSKEYMAERDRQESVDGGPPLGRDAAHIKDASVKRAYRRIVDAAPPGILRARDEMIVTLAASAYSRVLNGETLSASEQQQMTRMLGLIGCTPIDSQRITVPKKPEPKGTGRLGFLEIVKS